MGIDEVKEIILPILHSYKISKAGLFGSVTRGDLKDNSDLDLLVEMDKGISLLGFIRIKLELEQAVGRKVDLVEYNTIKPALKEKILKEQVKIL